MPPSKPHPSEIIAQKYLTQHGLKLIEQNYHSRYGEIDLIMQDQSTLVFIEVRQRSSQLFGGALDKDHQIEWVKDAFNAG
jgi:putative endonuclease